MNRRWFALILMLSLIPNCSGNRIETAPSEALYETKLTEAVGFVPFYDIEGTDGTVQAVPLGTQDAEGFRFVGEDILVFSGYPDTLLTLLDGCSFAVKRESPLSLAVFPDNPAVTATAAGITYVDESAGQLVFLDGRLEESNRISLPEQSAGIALSADQQKLYYCTADDLRVMDLNSGLDRPLKEMHFPRQEITALHCADTVLQCSILQEDGNRYTLFLSAENGSLLYESMTDVPLWTEDDLYFSIHMDGEYRELICGSADFGPSLLVTEADTVSIVPLLTRRLIQLRNEQPDGSTALDACDPITGRHTAQITLPERYAVTDIQPDPAEDSLWLLCHDKDAQQDVLCRWDLKKSDPKDPHCYLQPRWNPEHPDREGLAQCQALAGELSEKHGVRIRIWTDAGNMDCTGYQFVPEYQVPLIRDSLEELDQALSRYPEGFLKELAAPTGSGMLNICLVRNINSEGNPCAELLYWDHRGDAYLAVTPSRNLTQQVNRLLFDLTDSRVLAVSNAYDSWNRSDPTGSGHRNRIKILEAAVADGQAAHFASEAMQTKLLQISTGIRDAFRSAQIARKLPWEQYLAEPPPVNP